MTSLTLVVTALGALGWWRWWKASTHECEAVPQVLVPWHAPDHTADRPPREYITARCPDPGCDATIDLPIKRIRINHSEVGIDVTVELETHDLSVHEFSHPWAA